MNDFDNTLFIVGLSGWLTMFLYLGLIHKEKNKSFNIFIKIVSLTYVLLSLLKFI